jgi:hypothetical protein
MAPSVILGRMILPALRQKTGSGARAGRQSGCAVPGPGQDPAACDS